MKKIYGSLIIFFYFFKYPIFIYTLFYQFYLKVEVGYIMLVLTLISVVLIVKDITIFIKKKLKKNS